MNAFQHVNNTVYFRYFERMRFAVFEECGLLDEINSTGIGSVFASTQCRFKKPLKYPDSIYMGTRISGLEKDRFLVKYGTFSQELNSVATESEGFIIYYNDRDTIKAQMPDEHHRKLKSFNEYED